MLVATNSTTEVLFHNLTRTTLNTIIQSNNNHDTNYHSDQTNDTIPSFEIKQNIQLKHLALGVFLSFFCFITVFGNGLVIYAVVQERYLKSATYYYMASLACADLFVGLIVMPFAIVQVVYGDYWPFGKTSCDLWHSIDVCASTASILDLCVISLDRYSAITNPISYHQAFVFKRWPYLLITVWLCSGLISFPAIAYWRLVVRRYEVNRCLFPDDIYYILFSSLISFYIPLFVMIFVYIKIYRAAIKQLHAFKTGVKLASPTKKKKKKGLKNQDTPVDVPPDICLRIHRGKYHGIPSSARDSPSTISHMEPARSSNPDGQLNISRQKLSNPIKKSASGALLNDHPNSLFSRFSAPAFGSSTMRITSDNHQLKIISSNSGKGQSHDTISTYEISRSSKTNSSSGTSTSIGKRLAKFSKEQKATITLAYVMGIFVICWLPFFVYNPLTAVAKLFIQQRKYLTSVEQFFTGNELVFQVVTWFGCINSSVNPIIYAYSSREFRRAFTKYLCRCFPRRLRNLIMSYHNLYLSCYRRIPESYVSKENVNLGSDNNNIRSDDNRNNQQLISSSSTMTLTNMQKRNKKQQSKILKSVDARVQTKYSHIWFLTNCFRCNVTQQKEQNNKRRSSVSSSQTTVPTNVLVDYCTYHDVAVSRVTCV